LLIATELSTRQSVKTIVTGGVVRHGELSLVGPRAQSAFGDLNCDTVFLGVAGVSDTKGLTEYNLDDANVKRAALASGGRTIVLADASKIGQVAFVTVAPVTAIDLLITDASPDDATIRQLVSRGIGVLHVEPTNEETD
jgi:DeoR/GlpR family transcriptional regulator of sugar metabolism